MDCGNNITNGDFFTLQESCKLVVMIQTGRECPGMRKLIVMQVRLLNILCRSYPFKAVAVKG